MPEGRPFPQARQAGGRLLGEADIVDVADGGQVGGDRRCLPRPDAARDAVVARQLQADDEAAAAGGADRRHQFGDDARTPRQIAAVAIDAPIRTG